MAKRRESRIKTQRLKSLVLCEGQTEQWYFSQVLDTTLVKVEKSNKSNAKMLVEKDALSKLSTREWQAIYCVFDHDQISNPREHLEQANKVINESAGKLVRVFSNPCIEVAFWFYYSETTRPFADSNEAFEMLHIKLPAANIKPKSKEWVNHLCKNTDFLEICINAEQIYDKLEINSQNWLNITDGYSEIFNLKEFSTVKLNHAQLNLGT